MLMLAEPIGVIGLHMSLVSVSVVKRAHLRKRGRLFESLS